MDINDITYINDALNAIEKIRGYLKETTYDEFLKDEMKKDAVVYQVAIIGEAAGHISRAVRSSVEEVPWRKIIMTRNFLIHDYGKIDEELIWKTCKEDLKPLKTQLKELLDKGES